MKNVGCVLLLVCLLALSFPVCAEEATNEDMNRLQRVREMVTTAQDQEVSSQSKWMEEARSDDSELSASRVIQALALCLGVFFIFVACMKRLHKGSFAPIQKQLEVLEKVALGQKTSLVRVRYNQKELLLAVGGDEIKLLTTSMFPETSIPQAPFEEELNEYNNTHAINGFKEEDQCDTDVILSA